LSAAATWPAPPASPPAAFIAAPRLPATPTGHARRATRHGPLSSRAGTGVGVTAGLAGVDPIEMAALKATNPAEYQRRMRDLKKNPVKYMGNNIKNNGRKIGRGVKNGTRKLGQGVKRVFAKKN
jgi:hypothetical protein